MSSNTVSFATEGAIASSRSAIRVLVVDDSVVVRRMVKRALDGKEFEVIAAVSTAEAALRRLEGADVDLLTLDIHLPGMSGLELLPLLRQHHPRLHVLLFSSSSPASMDGCVDALMQGASGFLLKPCVDDANADAVLACEAELREKALQICGRRAQRTGPVSSPVARAVAPRPRKRRELLAIGVSTGGPTALAAVIAGLPHQFALPIVIVQHMPAVFTRLLADRIHASTGFNIVEAEDGMAVEPGRALLAPGNYHMRLQRTGLGVAVRLDQGPQECSCRPAVDVLFRSAAECYGGNVIATMLTGMGQDGLRGAHELFQRGAHVIAQDEASSVVWGMPGAVVQAGLAHAVLPLDQIAPAICQLAASR